MSSPYALDVRRYAVARLMKPDGTNLNVKHHTDIAIAAVRTDGAGNVPSMPLLMDKSCFGRPERFVRHLRKGKRWQYDRLEIRFNQSPCDLCALRSPGTHKSCAKVVNERIRSSPRIEAAHREWVTACGDLTGPRCFTLAQATPWHAFLQAIIDHGGWTNVNDDQVRIEAQRLSEARRLKRNAAEKARRARERQKRNGTATAVTADYLNALEKERDRRADHLRNLRCLNGNAPSRWLKCMSDKVCDRVADVWRARELLTRSGIPPTGQAIASYLGSNPAYAVQNASSLQARVYDDLKLRLARLEDDRGGEPIWAKWSYLPPTP